MTRSDKATARGSLRVHNLKSLRVDCYSRNESFVIIFAVIREMKLRRFELSARLVLLNPSKYYQELDLINYENDIIATTKAFDYNPSQSKGQMNILSLFHFDSLQK